MDFSDSKLILVNTELLKSNVISASLKHFSCQCVSMYTYTYSDCINSKCISRVLYPSITGGNKMVYL